MAWQKLNSKAGLARWPGYFSMLHFKHASESDTLSPEKGGGKPREALTKMTRAQDQLAEITQSAQTLLFHGKLPRDEKALHLSVSKVGSEMI